jgi:hypothetical protein
MRGRGGRNWRRLASRQRRTEEVASRQLKVEREAKKKDSAEARRPQRSAEKLTLAMELESERIDLADMGRSVLRPYTFSAGA